MHATLLLISHYAKKRNLTNCSNPLFCIKFSACCWFMGKLVGQLASSPVSSLFGHRVLSLHILVLRTSLLGAHSFLLLSWWPRRLSHSLEQFHKTHSFLQKADPLVSKPCMAMGLPTRLLGLRALFSGSYSFLVIHIPRPSISAWVHRWLTGGIPSQGLPFLFMFLPDSPLRCLKDISKKKFNSSKN